MRCLKKFPQESVIQHKFNIGINATFLEEILTKIIVSPLDFQALEIIFNHILFLNSKSEIFIDFNIQMQIAFENNEPFKSCYFLLFRKLIDVYLFMQLKGFNLRVYK